MPVSVFEEKIDELADEVVEHLKVVKKFLQHISNLENFVELYRSTEVIEFVEL